MGCRFQPKLSDPVDDLKVTWHWIAATSTREVFRMEDMKDHLESQDPDYRGRVTLLNEELNEGWAKLKVNTASGLFPVKSPQSDVLNLFLLLGITQLYWEYHSIISDTETPVSTQLEGEKGSNIKPGFLGKINLFIVKKLRL